MTSASRALYDPLMAELKTKATSASVSDFIDRIADEPRRKDCLELIKIMRQATKSKPRMWGESIVGFGDYHYKYPSGREGDWFLTGFSPRKKDLTVYLMAGSARDAALMARLGKHKTGKACLYIKRLSDIDVEVLRELIEASVKHLAQSGA